MLKNFRLQIIFRVLLLAAGIGACLYLWLATTSGYLHVRSDHIDRAWNSASDRVEARLGLRPY